MLEVVQFLVYEEVVLVEKNLLPDGNPDRNRFHGISLHVRLSNSLPAAFFSVRHLRQHVGNLPLDLFQLAFSEAVAEADSADVAALDHHFEAIHGA
ncbi:MAG: hypothetical protein M5U22_20385 [Thermoleophilia bacterium]|nr:hypothetical protein [Thermoleophilia bacterium]